VPVDRRCVEAMSTNKLTLVLAEIEAEVVQDALDLYLRARPAPADHRFEYRYRAARSVLDSLSHASKLLEAFPVGDDDQGHRDPESRDLRSRREQVED